MYFSNLPFPKPDAIIPDILHKVQPMANNVLDVDVLNFLSTEQEDILTKLAQLLVKLHNASHETNISAGDNIHQGGLKNLDLSVDQDQLIRRLHSLDDKVDQIANDMGINISNLTILDLLEVEQQYLCTVASNLDSQLTALAQSHNIGLSSDSKPLLNLCLHADPANPPVSVFLLLSWLRSSGRRVACISKGYKSVSQPSYALTTMINDRLSLIGNRKDHELILTVVWKTDYSVVDGCRLVEDDFNQSPIFGEMMTLIALCSHLGLDIGANAIVNLRSINKNLHCAEDVKASIATLINRLHKDINTASIGNVVIATFSVSSLLNVGAVSKANEKLRAAIDRFLASLEIDLDLLAA